MASYNRVILIGNVTRDIEMRYLPSGMAVVEMSLAVNDRRKAADGQWVDEVSFFDITLFGRTAEIAGEYLSKGSPVFIEGRLKQDTWEKDGQKRSKVKVICDKLQLIGSKDRSPGSSSGAVRDSSSRSAYVASEDDHDDSPPPVRSASRSHTPSGDGPGYDEPDIPF